MNDTLCLLVDEYCECDGVVCLQCCTDRRGRERRWSTPATSLPRPRWTAEGSQGGQDLASSVPDDFRLVQCCILDSLHSTIRRHRRRIGVGLYVRTDWQRCDWVPLHGFDYVTETDPVCEIGKYLGPSYRRQKTRKRTITVATKSLLQRETPLMVTSNYRSPIPILIGHVRLSERLGELLFLVGLMQSCVSLKYVNAEAVISIYSHDSNVVNWLQAITSGQTLKVTKSCRQTVLHINPLTPTVAIRVQL